MLKTQIEEFGWTAVPRNRANVPTETEARTTPVPIDFDSIWPTTHLVKQAQAHVKQLLPTKTFLHSLRVYCYGHTIVTQHFPFWFAGSENIKNAFFETWALTCLYHDIASTDEHRADSHMSFEWHGGFMALQELQAWGAPKAQAESVCESIIRHQDPGETGMISRMGQLVQLATELDNMGWQPHLVHEDVIKQIVEQLPRNKWSGCFAKTIEAEIEAKPWCHTTAIPDFAETVANNKTMEPYD